MPELVMTVGLPRSGKTTWACQQGLPIVSPDEIRLALHGQRFVGSAEGFVWAIAKVMVRALFGTGHERVVLDATSITEERRKDWLSSQWTCTYKVFRTSPEECELRALKTEREDIIPVIWRMNDEAEWPEDEA